MAGKKPVKQKTLLGDLFERRIPQIIGVYLAISWGLIQFIDWVATRFVLSPFLPEFAFVLLLSMLPTVILLAFFHGRPGRDRWTHVEKIAVPLNIFITGAILVMMFQGKELGAAETTITVRDETGADIQRKVLKQQFRKRVAIFFFENKSADKDQDYLKFGFPFLIDYDLAQDHYIAVRTAYDFSDQIKERGFSAEKDIPLTLKLKIAANSNIGYLMSGSFKKENDVYSLETWVYNTKNGKKIATNKYQGSNIFDISDEISVGLKEDMGLPAKHIENITDLPLSEIATSSEKALVNYVKSQNLQTFKNDYSGAQKAVENAINEDSLFSMAYIKLAELTLRANDLKTGMQVLEKTMGQLYKLPERLRFEVKSLYYYLSEQLQKRTAILNMWSELYPEDISSHVALYNHYRWAAGKPEKAIEHLKKILEIDPQQYQYLQWVGETYMEIGEYTQALNYYHEYARVFPKQSKSFTGLGRVYEVMGEFEKAKTQYERARLIEPDDPYMIDKVGDIERKLGNFDAARILYDEAMKKAKTDAEKSMVYSSLEGIFLVRGQLRKSLEYMDLKLNEQKKYQDPLNYQFNHMFTLYRYIDIGETERAFTEIKKIHFDPPFDAAKPLAYMQLYLRLEDADNAEKYLHKGEKFVGSYGNAWVKGLLFRARGQLYELQEKYEEAIFEFQKAAEISPLATDGRLFTGRCQRKLGRDDEALETLQSLLILTPSSGRANTELARVYLNLGDNAKAKQHLTRALDIWRDADKDYKAYKEALDLYAGLTG